jgi:putative Mn2+ efflux pump MntP
MAADAGSPIGGVGGLVILGIALGLDNFRVALAIGALDLTRTRRLQLAGAFGVAEAGSPLVGLAAGNGIAAVLGGAAQWAAPLALAACGAYVLVETARDPDRPETVGRRSLLFGLPIALSLDNLLAGAGVGFLGFPVVPSALVLGAMSAAVCLVGLHLGSSIVRWVPLRAEAIAGLAFIAIAILLATDPT